MRTPMRNAEVIHEAAMCASSNALAGRSVAAVTSFREFARNETMALSRNQFRRPPGSRHDLFDGSNRVVDSDRIED